MEYVMIPLRGGTDYGKQMVEHILGSMEWVPDKDGTVKAFPYDNENPVIITLPKKRCRCSHWRDGFQYSPYDRPCNDICDRYNPIYD